MEIEVRDRRCCVRAIALLSTIWVGEEIVIVKSIFFGQGCD